MKKYLNLNAFILLLFIFSGISTGKLNAASANLNQARNGTDLSPTNPVNWVNGNLGGSQAHYIEGMSSPYQCVMTGLTIGTQVSITIEYDVKNSGQHAFDYLTYYSRITPHGFTLHGAPETINPLTGTGLIASTPFTTYTIPAPSTSGSPVSGQPVNSYNSLPLNERKMVLYNGTIDTIYYLIQGDLSQNTSQTQVVVKFTPSAATSVLMWGAHIASRNDWGSNAGVPRSAGGISGSPFHMRLISWSYGSLGSQDRGLAGGSVFPPPAPLPVEITHFASHTHDATNVIEWTTATEINNDYFTVERSAGITNFESLGTVSGAGNSNILRNYSFTDVRPLSGISYYRLIQTDYDGTQKIFGPISLQRDGKQNSLSDFKIYLNNSAHNFYVSYYCPFDGEVNMEIVNTHGITIHTETLYSNEGMNLMEVSESKLTSQGIYFVRLSQGDIKTQAQKLVKY